MEGSPVNKLLHNVTGLLKLPMISHKGLFMGNVDTSFHTYSVKKILCRDALLLLCLQHVTIWRKSTTVLILKHIAWHLKVFYAHYCQTRKEKILTKEK